MHVFATSLQQTAERFLHAGYISASATGAVLDYPMLLDPEATGYAVSLEQAFATTSVEEATDASMTLAEVLWAAGPPALLAAVAGLALLRLRPIPRHLAPPVVLLATLLGGAWIGACLVDEDEGPWTYVDPEAATVILVRGLLPDALYASETPKTLEDLEDLQAFLLPPVDDPTRGLQQLLDDPSVDPWGTPLRFEVQHGDPAMGNDVYLAVSAGPDRELATADDIGMIYDVMNLMYSSDMYPSAYYLQRRAGVLWIQIRSRDDEQSLSDDWEAGDPGGLCLDGFWCTPLAEETLSAWWPVFVDSHGEYAGEPEPDWASRIDEIEAFYDQFTSAVEPEPVVVQLYYHGMY